MIDEIDERAQRDRDGAGADGDVRIIHADHVDQQRHREDRAAAPDHAQDEAHQ